MRLLRLEMPKYMTILPLVLDYLKGKTIQAWGGEGKGTV